MTLTNQNNLTDLRNLLGQQIKISGTKAKQPDQTIQGYMGTVEEVHVKGAIFVSSENDGIGYWIDLNQSHEIELR